jgi:hypothetical protein
MKVSSKDEKTMGDAFPDPGLRLRNLLFIFSRSAYIMIIHYLQLLIIAQKLINNKEHHSSPKTGELFYWGEENNDKA